ncbi:inositol monophosphatase [Mycena alexandri]|uniref:Inositol-1-monophosphatase n=1 Tax=Mycena alexandri TaxID=1745969 RepID=A0AAD6TB07_9AGAR|nr:inositol monophosphatase [Mycena alexandri]
MSDFSIGELQKLHDVACTVARLAGNYMREDQLRRRQAPLATREKLNSVDLVTAADETVEKMIKDSILKEYPDHAFIGEESYSAGEEKRFLLKDGPTWIIDPIDGTVNMVHMFPMTAISIGFCLKSIPTVGVVFAPFLGGQGTMYSAIHHPEGGAWLSELGPDGPTTPLPLTSPPPPLPLDAPKGCLFFGEYGKDRRDHPQSNLTKKAANFVNMATEIGGRGGKGGMVHGIRSLGSSTMDMVYVASGQGDIMFEAGCWEWDVCAGIAILLQTGGIVVDSNPPLNLQDSDPIPMANLGGRRYLAIRGCSEDSTGRSPRMQQEALVREVWKRTERLDYQRPV